ncbi:MAG TPA: hypothetical protein EYH34_18595, partial [Planctomycetes bacterium]|nr:hypothetical protein [Planctomycetota bacterium]
MARVEAWLSLVGRASGFSKERVGMKRRYVVWHLVMVVCASLVSAGAGAAAEKPARLPLPGVDVDPDVPTLKQVLGFDWARRITTPRQIERYLHRLAKATGDRTRLVRYGKTYEGNNLYYVVISSPANIRRLDEIRAANLRLADPRQLAGEQAAAVIERSPAIVWLAYSTHGNECSPADAALLTAYHLVADRRGATRRWLERVVVIIDPLQNPDGRDRFVHSFRKNHGVFADPYPWASEHTEPWPGGRTNHYWFDMNRDWFLQSQREMQAKVKAYLDWQPQIYVDAHEMGRDRTYYFTPPTEPVLPFLLAHQREWLFRIGRHQGRWFDERGFRYTTREMFDAYYPGYGSQWPTLQGAIGILWEQAGVRGLVIARSDRTRLRYPTAVLHHYVSGLATVEVAAENRQALLRDFYEAQRRAIQLGHDGPVRHYFLLEGRTPQRARRLAEVLAANRIEVRRLSESVSVKAKDIRGGEAREVALPAGTYHVPVAQPAGRLVRTLLDREVPMGEEFVKRQLERNKQYLPDEIYDVTAWSLPLAFGVRCLATDRPVDPPGRAL